MTRAGSRFQDIGQGFWRVKALRVPMEEPNVPDILRRCAEFGLKLREAETSFFLSRETIIPSRRSGYGPLAGEPVSVMAWNSQSATSFSSCPPTGWSNSECRWKSNPSPGRFPGSGIGKRHRAECPVGRAATTQPEGRAPRRPSKEQLHQRLGHLPDDHQPQQGDHHKAHRDTKALQVRIHPGSGHDRGPPFGSGDAPRRDASARGFPPQTGVREGRCHTSARRFASESADSLLEQVTLNHHPINGSQPSTRWDTRFCHTFPASRAACWSSREQSTMSPVGRPALASCAAASAMLAAS